MKSAVTAICLLIPLVALFVIIDRKDSFSGNNVMEQKETVTGRKPSTMTTQAIEQSTETKPAPKTKLMEIRPVAGTKPEVETKPVAQANPVTVKPIEAKPVAKIKPTEEKPVSEEKLAPVAITVVSVEEAEKLNVEALAEFERQEKRRIREQERIAQGYQLVYFENFKDCKTVSLSATNKEQLSRSSYDLQEFTKRKIPKSWNVDYTTIPSETSFQIMDNGYTIDSPKGLLRFVGPYLDGMRSSFHFELTIKNEGNDDCNISLGIHNLGLIKNGYTVLGSEIIHSKEAKQCEKDLNVFDQFSNIAPTITIKGKAQLLTFKVYRKIHDDFTVVEGEIVERSELPDPDKSDYPDCRYTAHFVGNEIVSGNPCNKELSLSIDGFKNYKVLPSDSLKKGDKVKIGIISINSISDELASIQESDELSLFSLQSYYVNSVERIKQFSDYSESRADQIPFLDSTGNEEYISIYERKLNPPIPDKLLQCQKTVIKEDLERINILLAPWTEEKIATVNQDFDRKWLIEKAKDPPDYNRVSGTVWRNIDNSFWALPESYNLISPNYSTINSYNMEALVEFKEYLETQGIQLIISLIPHYYDMAARIINKDFLDVPDFRTISIVKQLLENNIEAVYPSEEVLRNYNKHEISFYYPKDPHPSELPQEILSDIISSRLLRYEFKQELNPADFSVKTINLAETYPSKCDIGNNTVLSHYTCNKLYYKNKTIQNDSNSPVLILGNSFSNTPTGNALSELVTLKTLIPIAHYSISGTGILSSCIQRIFHHPETFLQNKKVVVLQVGTMHFEANVTLPNVCQLDKEYILLNGRRIVKQFKPKGNSTAIPDFTEKLIEPSVFEILSDGKVSILDFVLDDKQTDKDICLEVTYCCKANNRIMLEINDQVYSLPSVQDSYLWCKKVIPLSFNTKKISIKALGPKGAFIAVGNIIIYQ